VKTSERIFCPMVKVLDGKKENFDVNAELVQNFPEGIN
jgi:hypothetical protein